MNRFVLCLQDSEWFIFQYDSLTGLRTDLFQKAWNAFNGAHGRETFEFEGVSLYSGNFFRYVRTDDQFVQDEMVKILSLEDWIKDHSFPKEF